MRADDEGFVGDDGFCGILTTCGKEGFSDDDGVDVGDPCGEFAGGIDEEDLVGGGCGLGKVGAKGHLVAGFGECAGDFVAAFGVTRDDDGECVGESVGDGFGDEEFFAGEGGCG